MSEQIGLDKAISMAVNTGEVIFGTNKALKLLKHGEGKAFIIANNCQQTAREELYFRAEKAKLSIIEYSKNSWELGSACGRPHKISIMTIMNPGDSKILDYAE